MVAPVKMKSIIIIIYCLVLPGCGQVLDNGTNSTANSGINLTAGYVAEKIITPGYLRNQVAIISADRFEGRAPGSPGDAAARRYLRQHLESKGYLPGAAGGQWEQLFELVGITADIPDTWAFTSAGGDLVLHNQDDFIASSGIQNGGPVIEDAELVFVGYGIIAPEYAWNDYKGEDMQGKVLVMMNNDPDWDPELFQGNTRLSYGRWTYKYEIAAKLGAAGAIIIHTTPSAGYPFQVVQTSWTGEQFELPDSGDPRIQVAAWVTEQAAQKLLDLSGLDLGDLIESARSRDFRPVDLGIKTSIKLEITTRTVTTANVLGLLPGSDPVRNDEVVIYTAHHDHLGKGKPDDRGDQIYNGARDNGAGMAVVLSIADAFSALPEPPARSILIAFVGAEEQGLLGSEYYAVNPTFAPGKIAANINYDSGNIWGRTRDLTFVGYGKSSLDRIIDTVAAIQGRMVKPDQLPDKGYFYRSDQYNLAKIGVPAMYLKSGTDFVNRPPGWGKEQMEYHDTHHYHQPSDELRDDWNFEGLVEDARAGFLTGLIIGNMQEMPVWNKGDEFESTRLQALQAVNN